MHVTAVRKGYFGGKIRDPGERLEIDDEIMADEARRPSWVEPIGTDLPPADAVDDERGGGPDGESLPGKGGREIKARGRKAKAVAEPKAGGAGLTQLPPRTAPDGTGVVEGLGGPAPDWLPPGDRT